MKKDRLETLMNLDGIIKTYNENEYDTSALEKIFNDIRASDVTYINKELSEEITATIDKFYDDHKIWEGADVD
jgi:K+/H+ antiporter YhaU regulatory subunit KhtT